MVKSSVNVGTPVHHTHTYLIRILITYAATFTDEFTIPIYKCVIFYHFNNS